jgi:hypothetical protein
MAKAALPASGEFNAIENYLLMQQIETEDP